MASVSGISTISKVFSKLGDNTGSVVPMYVKDFTSDSLTSFTYFKDGGKMDGVEKTVEEFGTGILWLGGIPFLKKFIFDDFLFKKANINPNVDAKRLFTKGKENSADTIEFAKQKAVSLGDSFREQAEILSDTIKNKNLAKNLSLAKFGVSTLLTGAALFGIITLKQKNTEKQIEKQVREKINKDNHLKNAIKKTDVYQTFKGTKENNNTSFKGLESIGTFFMTNPIANTTLVDGVITGTRLVEAREGERFEVGLKEFCQLLFIYGLAQPLQKSMEFIGKNVFKKPIDLDYSVLDSSVIKDAINAEQTKKGSSVLLKQAKEIVNINGNNQAQNAKDVVNYIFDHHNEPISDVLKRTGDVGTYKTKEGIEQLSLLSSINANKVKNTAQKTINLIENAVDKDDVTKYLKTTKFLKGAAIVLNIGISALLMGYLQPQLNLYLRKKFHNGDNTNPAIKNLTQKMEQKIAFEGKESEN